MPFLGNFEISEKGGVEMFFPKIPNGFPRSDGGCLLCLVVFHETGKKEGSLSISGRMRTAFPSKECRLPSLYERKVRCANYSIDPEDNDFYPNYLKS